MNIHPITQTNFQGYDARPLRGFLMGSNQFGIATEMAQIGRKEGFRVFSAFNARQGGCGEYLPVYNSGNNLWAQDLWTIVRNKLLALTHDITSSSIRDFFNLKYDLTQWAIKHSETYNELNRQIWQIYEKLPSEVADLYAYEELGKKQEELKTLQNKSHIAGGNLFIVEGDSGEELFIGEKEMDKFSEEDLKDMYCTNKVIVLPQMDFHLDMFIRPLDKKRILLADDEMTLKFLDSSQQKDFKNSMDKHNYAKAEEVEKILKDNGYKVIRVPGRAYDYDGSYQFLRHNCNYLNANVLKNSKGKLVYITNKSNFSPKLEKAFIKSISPYVNKDRIYFIRGEEDFVAEEMLPNLQGGIHCTCSEVL